MNSRAALGLSVFLFGFCLRIGANDLASAASPRVQAEARPGRMLKLSFPTVSDKKYQMYVSGDLRWWKFLGNVTNGTGGIVTVEHPQTNAQTAFFRVASADTTVRVPLKLQGGQLQLIGLDFPTTTGKKYQVYYSRDLQRWDVLSDLIDGTGGIIGLDVDISQDAVLFFRAETTGVFPAPSMVKVQPGTFLMGSPLTEKDRDLNEDPLTNVTLSHGFWIGKYEVTQGEYEEVMGTNPSRFKGDSNRPVEQVNWLEATAYCARLTELERAAGRLPTGYAYRLPTESEFEYVCRAGTTTRFSFGDDPDYTLLGDYAWYVDNSGRTTHPVGQKKPNPFGLHDINGNVWEWCLDWFHDPYPGGSVTNPSGPSDGRTRSFRGGGGDYEAYYCRSAFRNYVSPTRRIDFLGFRVVLSAIQP